MRSLTLTTLLLIAALFPAWVVAGETEWTVLLYMDSEEAIIEDAHLQNFVEISSIGSTADVNFVAMITRAKGNSTKSYGDWGGVRRGLIAKGDTPVASWGESLSDRNFATSETLAEFIHWGTTTYPSRKVALVLMGHGYGIKGLFADTDPGTNNHTSLNFDRIDAALSLAGQHFDLMALEVCNGGMWEFAHTVAPYADVLVSAERTIFTPGIWAWNLFADDLKADPAMNGTAFAKAIVAGAASAPNVPTIQCISAVDLSAFAATDGAMEQLNRFASIALRDGSAADLKALHTEYLVDSSANYVTGYTASDAIDVGDYLAKLLDSPYAFPASIRSAAQTALTAYQAAIIDSRMYGTSSPQGDSGLSIYAPYSFDTQTFHDFSLEGEPLYYTTVAKRFTDASPWNEFWDAVIWQWQVSHSYTHNHVLDTVPPTATVAAVTNGSVRIDFNDEMATQLLMASDVTLTGPLGSVSLANLALQWDADANHLDLTFASQTASGTYTVALAPVLTDSSGNRIDQDQDGTGGEANDDRILASFEVEAAEPSAFLLVSQSGTAIDADGLDAAGAIAPGGTALTYVIANTGSGAATLGTVAVNELSGCTTTVTAAPAAALAPGATSTLTINVRPSGLGPWLFQVAIPNSSATSPYRWTVSGTVSEPDLRRLVLVQLHQQGPWPGVQVIRQKLALDQDSTTRVTGPDGGITEPFLAAPHQEQRFAFDPPSDGNG